MDRSKFIAVALATSSALAFAHQALAQTAPDSSPPAEVVVTAPIQRSETDVLGGTSIVSGTELTREMRPTIGETLARQPGVSATSFGPNASRPVLRGFQGDRIRVLEDGIGAIDVSNTSADHAVVIDPLLAERIEVLRGPSALLFGSSAVGGVVNVVDTRIPRSVPAKGYRLQGNLTYGSAANERSAAAAGDVSLGQGFVAHADGSYSKTDDLRIGGYALTPERRREALAAALLAPPASPGDPDFAANAAIHGILPNTASRSWAAGLGLAYVGDRGNLGISFSHNSNFYGVPVRYATNVGDEQEAPRLDMIQNRLDLRAEVNTDGGFLDKIRLRAATAQYRHYELEEDGSIGTTFRNKGTEARLELVQAKHDGWQGATGAQFFSRDFDVNGDEAFLPRSSTEQLGLFTVQDFEIGALHAEAGLRYETTDLTSKAIAGDLRFPHTNRHFNAISASAGATYAISPEWHLGVNLSHTERAPTAEELFSNGPHGGTQAWQLGNPNFKLERSWGVEATLHGHGQGYSLDASVFYNRFSNYIYEIEAPSAACVAAAAPSGRTVDLPCFPSLQANATYVGAEFDGSVKLAQVGNYGLHADLLGDWVQATILNGGGPVPRIPAKRLLGGLEAQADKTSGRIEVEHVFGQDRIATFETPTADYTMVNASLSLQPFSAMHGTTLTLSANNIFDVDARRHASVLKDYAPLPGRDLRATLHFAL